jgi:hypothetical protein
MPIFQMQIETEHPVLFLSDSGPDVAIPADTGEVFATCTADCICFWVLSYVDGASLVTIADRDCELDGLKLFSGSIAVRSGTVSVSDSSSYRYLNIPVPAGDVAVDIWADDDKSPEWVWVKLGAIRNGL